MMSEPLEMNHRRPILIDTDTASDDAVALIMALRSPRVEVKAITIVAGNVPVQQAKKRALRGGAMRCRRARLQRGRKAAATGTPARALVPRAGWSRRSRV